MPEIENVSAPSYPLVREYRLANGCRVLVRPTPGKAIVAMTASVRWGARDLPREQAGLSAMLARLLVKGTRERSALQIAETLEAVGGEIDPFCGQDSMGLDVQCLEDDWETAVEVLGDCLFNTTAPDDEFEKERVFMQAAVQRSEDDKFSYSRLRFEEMLYGDHPYAVRPQGTVESLARLDVQTVRALHRRVFRPENLLLVVVGNVPEELFCERIESLWRAPDGGGRTPLERPEISAPPYTGLGRSGVFEKQVEQGFFVMGFAAPRVDEPDASALRLACASLGEGMSGRLFARLRDRDHLAYSVGAALVARERASHLFLFIGTGPETLEKAQRRMHEEVEAFLGEGSGPTPAEIERGRRYVLGKMLIGRQTNDALARLMSAAECWGLGWQWVERAEERMRATTLEQAADAARRWLRDPASVVLRPSNA